MRHMPSGVRTGHGCTVSWIVCFAEAPLVWSFSACSLSVLVLVRSAVAASERSSLSRCRAAFAGSSEVAALIARAASRYCNSCSLRCLRQASDFSLRDARGPDGKRGTRVRERETGGRGL